MIKCVRFWDYGVPRVAHTSRVIAVRVWRIAAISETGKREIEQPGHIQVAKEEEEVKRRLFDPMVKGW